MPTSGRSKHDVIRERRLNQKLARVKAEWSPIEADRSWMKFARCKICREKYCVNNNPQREVRPLRMLGVAICAHCFYSRGTKRLVCIYLLGKKLADAGEFDGEYMMIATEKIGDLIREAKGLFDG